MNNILISGARRFDLVSLSKIVDKLTCDLSLYLSLSLPLSVSLCLSASLSFSLSLSRSRSLSISLYLPFIYSLCLAAFVHQSLLFLSPSLSIFFSLSASQLIDYYAFRPTIIRKIIDNLDEITSADAMRVALWLLGEYCDSRDASVGRWMRH